MKQKSKLVSLLLTLCMALTLLPAAAFAQETIAGDSPAKAQGVAPAAQSADDVAVQAGEQYAAASLKLTGYTVGADISKAAIETTSSTGFKSITLRGFKIKSDDKFGQEGTFEQGKTYYVSIEMQRADGYTLQMQGNKSAAEGNTPEGVTLKGATLQALPANTNYLIFKMNASPAAAPVEPPVFTDGFGTPDCKFNTYIERENVIYHDREDCTFAGWYDSEGNKLTSADAAEGGKTYTAKWTKLGGKTVRTTPLILTDHATEDNTDEGWSWDAEMNTLTLNGVTIDVSDASKATSAITLPAGALIITAGTNTVVAGSGIDAITGIDTLTINGTGSLSVKGDSGIFISKTSTSASLTINVPLTAKATGSTALPDFNAAICGDKGTTINYDTFNLKLEKPANWKLVNDDSNAHVCVAGADGKTPAMEVVIVSAGSVVEPTITDLKLTPAAASVAKGKTQQFKATMIITPAEVTPTLTWSVTGNKSNATKIDQTGLLTVGADETAATLTVTVSASVAGGEAVGATATVTVTSPSTSPKYYYKNTGTTSSSNTPNKSPKTADAGIALYAGMAAASLLGSGVVLNRKRKNF